MSGLEASLLLGSVHSVLLAIALLRRKRNRRANHYLAALLGALSLLLLDGFLRAHGALATHPHLIGFTAWVPFVLGPLVFLYVREMTAPDPARSRAPWHHFVVPGAYVVILIATFFPRSASYKRNVAEHGGAWFVSAIEVGLLVYGITYAIAALVLLRRHRRYVQEIYSNLRGVSLRWLFVLAALNAIVWIAALAAFVIRITGMTEASAASVIVPIGSTITVFVVGYFQLGQVEIYVGQPAVELPQSPSEVVPEAADAPEPPEASEAPRELKPSPAYQRARLADDDAAAVEARIKAAMTDQRLYQRAGLTLAELADEVAATPHEVSQVLSTRLQRNFYTFINEHRIEHVKTGLRTTDRPVLDLAFEAGFQSKSTFNSAFRKATGTTPRQYRQRAST
jgi:AraC-like DNA-binding protein